MMIYNEIKPELSIYYLGSELIKRIDNAENKVLDFNQLCKNMIEDFSISANLFIFTLDWLFLLDVITLNELGEVVLCS